ncbi:MAG: hypothetical protein RLZZ126_1194, partial [Pseudomonadota bacterium]
MEQSVDRNAQWVRVLGAAVWLACAALPGVAQPVTDATIGAALQCGQLKGLAIPDAAIGISKAEAVPGAAPNTVLVRPPLPDLVLVALPPYCRVDGDIDPRTGSDGKPYAIGFTIALTDRWN